MPAALLALAPLAINLVSGLFGKSESDKLADKISGLKTEMPEEEKRAEALSREMSQMGLPGYETYRENINEMIPTTFSEAKKVAQSPSQLIDLGAKALTATNDAYNKLAVSDATAKLGNMQNYQQVLQNKANMNLGIQSQNNQIDMASYNQEAQGTKDLISSVNQGVGSAINTYGMTKQLDYQENHQKYLDSFFGNTDKSTNPTANAGANVGSNDQLNNILNTNNQKTLQSQPDIDQYVNEMLKQFGFSTTATL